MLLPHESTVAHEQRFIMEAPMISRTRSRTALGHPHVIGESSNASINEQQHLLHEQFEKDISKLQVRKRAQIYFKTFFFK